MFYIYMYMSQILHHILYMTYTCIYIYIHVYVISYIYMYMSRILYHILYIHVYTARPRLRVQFSRV